MLNLPVTKEKAVADFKARAEDEKSNLTATAASTQIGDHL